MRGLFAGVDHCKWSASDAGGRRLGGFLQRKLTWMFKAAGAVSGSFLVDFGVQELSGEFDAESGIGGGSGGAELELWSRWPGAGRCRS